MVVAEYIGIGSGLFLCFVGVWRVAATSKAKVSYSSFDRYKDEVEEKYVGNKVCNLNHQHVKEALDRLEKGQGKILDLIRNGTGK